MKKHPIGNQSNFELTETIAKSRTKLLWTLVLSTITCTALTAFAPFQSESFYSGVLAIFTSGGAFAMSLQIVYRQKLKGLFPRLYASLAIGLALWFIAEVTWAYYELVAAIENPTPSIADVFWLAGYVPFFYFLYGMLRNFAGSSRSMILQVSLVSSIGMMLLAYVMFSISQSADLSSQEGITTYLVNAAYPVADMFLIIPAVASFIQLRGGKLTSTPWAFIIVATIIFIVADIGFAYFTILELYDTIWIWNPLYNLGDLAIASSLFWHKAFFTIDERKLLKDWQEKNR
jgi:hypothetical protein